MIELKLTVKEKSGEIHVTANCSSGQTEAHPVEAAFLSHFQVGLKKLIDQSMKDMGCDKAPKVIETGPSNPPQGNLN
jgi:hypothetical protein